MQILTYWLIPAEPARSYFAAVISDFAARFDAPVFEPHVTIYTIPLGNEKAADVLDRVLADRGTYRLLVSSVDYGDEFTKTVFVQFQRNKALTQLNADLWRASAIKNDETINPHVSLLYKTLPRQTKEEIATSVRIPFTEVQFDSAKAVISPADIKSREHVEAWRVVATRKLRG